MIRINLLGAPKPKRGSKRAVTTMTDMSGGTGGGGGGMNPLIPMALAVVLACGFVWFRYSSETHRADKIQADTVKADSENRRLAAVKTKYDQEQKVKDNYERRVKVIDDLRSNQSGPVNLLTMIGDTVNSTDAVWLDDMQDAGNTINIEGTALSANAVANLIKNLQKTGYFKTVELAETMQDNKLKDVQAFTFKLSCEKQKA